MCPSSRGPKSPAANPPPRVRSQAEYIMRAWEQRWEGTPAAERAPPPLFIHSNLDSFEHILAVSRLPARVRPAVCAFGTLADGFPPFRGGGQGTGAGGERVAVAPPDTGKLGANGTPPLQAAVGATTQIKLCSVVMKVIQV